jgi:hypothetical protein
LRRLPTAGGEGGRVSSENLRKLIVHGTAHPWHLIEYHLVLPFPLYVVGSVEIQNRIKSYRDTELDSESVVSLALATHVYELKYVHINTTSFLDHKHDVVIFSLFLTGLRNGHRGQ